MITMAQRIESLRTQRNISRPALSAALGLPRTAIEKFESGRQTPTQEQQAKLAKYFGVSLTYLRGESDTPTDTDSWLSGAYMEERPAPAPSISRPVPKQETNAPTKIQEDGAVFGALLKSKSFQSMIRDTVLDVLRSPEGQELIAKAIRKSR